MSDLDAVRLDSRTVRVTGWLNLGRVYLDTLLRRAAATYPSDEGRALALSLLDAPRAEQLIFLDMAMDEGWHVDAAQDLARGQYMAVDRITVDLKLEVGNLYRVPWMRRVRSLHGDYYVAILTRLTRKSVGLRRCISTDEFDAERLYPLWDIAVLNA